MIHLSTAGWCFGLLALAFVLVTRVISVMSCSSLVNMLKRIEGEPNIVGWRHQVMMWWGGLRGGITLVLALEINGEWCQHKSIVLNVTFMITCILLISLGGTTELMLQKLGMVKSLDDRLSNADIIMMSGSMDCVLPTLPRAPDAFTTKVVNGLDKSITRALVGPREIEKSSDFSA